MQNYDASVREFEDIMYYFIAFSLNKAAYKQKWNINFTSIPCQK